MFSTSDTIVAIATPPGHGGIGVIRISGAAALPIACRLAQRGEPFVARHATFVTIQTGRGALDHVIVTTFLAPHSYTGEDVAEISAHGSPVVLRAIVAEAMRAGARLANPGEFTFRAYLHGRLDLVQAEAVRDLVDAVTPLQARAAMDQLEGTLTSRITEVEAGLYDLVARLEASIDFPEEGFHFVTREEAVRLLEDVAARLGRLRTDATAGRMIREGGLVVIVGRPNAGKSSLFNALVGSSRAIVTPTAGTTRDALTERVDVGGLALTLVDTAGLHESVDPIEVEGMRRARDAQDVALLSLVVVDATAAVDADDLALLSTDRQQIVVQSKIDLGARWTRGALGTLTSPIVSVSATTGEGLDELRSHIVAALTSRDVWRDPPAVSNVRHANLIGEAADGVAQARRCLTDGEPEEVVLAELSVATAALEQIRGRRASDDLLKYVFSRFCIGK